MLTIASSNHSNKGYSTGHRGRQLLLSAGNELGAITDISAFTLSGSTGNAAQVIQSEDLRVVGTATTNIKIVLTPGVSYTFSIRAVGFQSGNRGQINVGNSAGDSTYHASGNLTSESTQTGTFTPTQANVYFTVSSVTDNKWARYDNFSLQKGR
tara:strand:+ start:3454 stop:3915 length:462 start_codon:yes stop_codon:yes gene_type:complete